MAKIFIPSIGVAMEEALLLKWLKQPGDVVVAGEAVAEIETDKAAMELESPVSGTMGAHLFEPEAIIPVGTTISEVLEEGEKSATQEIAPSAVVTNAAPSEDSSARASEAATDGGAAPHALSPKARRLAKERDAASGIPADAPAPTERFRALIAAKVSESWREIPHFSVTREIDAEPMLATLEMLRASHTEPSSTLTDLMLRALALALRERGDESGDVGLAVATEHGVVIPVIKNVLDLDAWALSAARSAAVERARGGRLSQQDLEATPSSTLSNLGAFGVDQFTGIVALGQTSLLTVGRAAPRATVDDARNLAVRTSFTATLNADHRTIDGAAAAELLAAFATAAETLNSTF
jgi:pyruvate dehydrogenase E2 component (dihydrolipoamide acetyltransferase)